MKALKKIRTINLAVIVFLLVSNALLAQRTDSVRTGHHGRKDFRVRADRGAMGIPNLTDDQKTKIKAQQVAFGKEALPLRNQLIEKRAHLRTLQTASTYDANAVNATIDDISKTESQLLKKSAANHEAIRKLLNDEQRLAFDSHQGFRRGPARFHNGHGRGHRN